MCEAGQRPGAFAGTGGYAGMGEALVALKSSLAFLAAADMTSVPAGELAGCLRELERAESVHTAARAGVLAAFTAQAGPEGDGHGSVKTWLAWQTRVTRGAAAGAVGWMRRLSAHRQVADALAAGTISGSWARQVCDWSQLLPEDRRDDADQILLAAAAGGADLADLGGLAQEMLHRSAPPDPDRGDRGFGERSVQLDVHYQGAGKLAGDLTPECTAAVAAMLESLGKKAGPEDQRTQGQRNHDALEEGCRRLAGAAMLPDVAGQATQVQLQVTLEQLLDLGGAAGAERAWAAGRAGADGEPGWLASRAAAQAYSCDAQVTTMVTGSLDPGALANLVRAYLIAHGSLPRDAGPEAWPPDRTGWEPRGPSSPPGRHHHDSQLPGAIGPGATDRGAAGSEPMPSGLAATGPAATTARLSDALLRYALGILSGPTGLAAALRTGLPGPQAAGVSLPLDVSAATATVPPHLRRAVIRRDRHCAFPGCRQRPPACHVHHIRPRSEGGPTALPNLVLLCSFHHGSANKYKVGCGANVGHKLIIEWTAQF